MQLTAEPVDIGSRTPVVLLNSADAAELSVHPLDRVQISHGERTSTGIVEITDALVDPGELGVTRAIGHVTGEVAVTVAGKPDAVAHISKKLDGQELEGREIETVVQDINRDRLNDVELTAFVTGVYVHGLSRDEILRLTVAMVDAGRTIEWDVTPVVDKHSIGGVAGNRVTPVVVPTVAAAGLTVPKTSSRAVTSAAGTADTLEVFCDVEFSIAEIKDIVRATGGCMVWGGAMDISPVDDKIIRAETPLSLDPEGQVVASVLSKKASAGATHFVIDIPYGEGAKVESLPAAREMAEDFSRVGATLGLDVACTITRGHQPIGQGIGPVLEGRDVLRVLRGDGPEALRAKSERLAQVLFDEVGVDANAGDLIDSGAAEAKFREIVAAQNGDPDVALADLQPGAHDHVVTADRDGAVTHIDNRLVNELARRAGAPKDRAAGVELACTVGDAVAAGDRIATLYAESADKLEQAVGFCDDRKPIQVLPANETVVEQW